MWKSVLLCAALASLPVTANADALARAHAHNDYEHERPLFDALEQGFASVEADIWLVDGELLVAHDLDQVEPGRTLESLYLEPLRDLVRAQRGVVHPGFKHSVQLLIDIKSEGEATYAALHKVLARYPDLLTVFTAWGVREGAVTAVISGNRPRETLRAQWLRFAGYDGRAADLGVETDPAFAPLISDNWTNLFGAELSDEERTKLHDFVSLAHANGQRVRFWATPEDPATREAVWAALIDAGVDYINTDDLAGLHAYLRAEDPTPHAPELDWFGRYYGFDPR
ncbi:MAG TPA: phosphatidylinositol-specific phospholipase C/glycerophosphodiester phosphodiesterase family protein [Polyangiales bacterium]|nr:phosphatidylinositol-specific phospholipase C/glycerophosphodiester phosphodiesterase family protein [Polyangiales bacterium]